MPDDGLRHLLLNTVVASEVVSRHRRAALMRRCGVDIPLDAKVFAGQRFRPGRVSFGRDVIINRECLFDPGDAYIEIGDHVGIASRVVLSAAGHHVGGSNRRADGPCSLPIVIEDGCWIGTGVTVLPGVTIRRGCLIGAGAVVTRDTEPNGIYMGVPAVRRRDLPESAPDQACERGTCGMIASGGMTPSRPAW